MPNQSQSSVQAGQNQSNQNRLNKSSTGRDRFLILGHPYLLYDDYISGRIFKKLEALSVEIELASLEAIGLDESFIQWDMADKMYSRIMSIGAGDYQGIIQLSAFNCGCDSIMLDIFRAEIIKKGLPYLILMIDEHTAPGGIDTRLEAFVDSVNWATGGKS